MINALSVNTSPTVFNRTLLSTRRTRAAGSFGNADFLKTYCAELVADRLLDVQRTFPTVVELGCHTGGMQALLPPTPHYIACDISPAMTRHASGIRVVCDEEFLPFAENSVDLVVSAFSLHWVNDLPGCLLQIRRILKPDGLFLAVIPGGNSLRELRDSLNAAELACRGGLSPRVSPFVDVRDAGMLLQRAGFALPVVDTETLTITYAHPLKLLHDLRTMGEANAMMQQEQRTPPRRLFPLAMEHYQQHYTNKEGRVPATFELLTLTGWKPHHSQQQAARRGSGQVSLREVLK